MTEKKTKPAVPFYTDKEIREFMSDDDIKELGHRLGYLFPDDPGFNEVRAKQSGWENDVADALAKLTADSMTHTEGKNKL